MRNVRCHACDERTDEQWKVVQYSVWAESAIFRFSSAGAPSKVSTPQYQIRIRQCISILSLCYILLKLKRSHFCVLCNAFWSCTDLRPGTIKMLKTSYFAHIKYQMETANIRCEWKSLIFILILNTFVRFRKLENKTLPQAHRTQGIPHPRS